MKHVNYQQNNWDDDQKLINIDKKEYIALLTIGCVFGILVFLFEKLG